MYLVGADHSLKKRVIELVSSLAATGEVFVTSAESFQEIIHRYKALNDSKHLKAAYGALEDMVDQVFDVTKKDTDLARHFSFEYPSLSSRDCLHTAIMKKVHCSKIWTYDQRFDEIPQIIRIY